MQKRLQRKTIVLSKTVEGFALLRYKFCDIYFILKLYMQSKRVVHVSIMFAYENGDNYMYPKSEKD
jgi:hypothetical protein